MLISLHNAKWPTSDNGQYVNFDETMYYNVSHKPGAYPLIMPYNLWLCWLSILVKESLDTEWGRGGDACGVDCVLPPLSV